MYKTPTSPKKTSSDAVLVRNSKKADERGGVGRHYTGLHFFPAFHLPD